MKPPNFAPILLALFFCSSPAFPQTASGPSKSPTIRDAETEVARAQDEASSCDERVAQIKDRMSGESGLISITPEAVRQLAEHLQSEKESLEVDEAGAKGREDAITKAIDQSTIRLRSRADSDEVTKQMETVVAARQAALDRLQKLQAAGAAPQGEIDSAKA